MKEENDKFYDESELGNYVVACNVCGQIAIADNEEELKNVACSECGNVDWSVLPYQKGSPIENDNDNDLKEEEKETIKNAGYGNRWKPSKKQRQDFATKMQEINEFCEQNGIAQSASGDSYYFTIDGQKYRVSNHAVEQRKGRVIGYDPTGNPQRQQLPDGWTKRKDDVIYIHAGKTRIIEIYNALKEGKQLDGFGNPI